MPLPAEEIAILANLVREEGLPVPYSGQRAIRSAAILGRWSVLTRTDLKKSTFCRLEPVVIQASGS